MFTPIQQFSLPTGAQITRMNSEMNICVRFAMDPGSCCGHDPRGADLSARRVAGKRLLALGAFVVGLLALTSAHAEVIRDSTHCREVWQAKVNAWNRWDKEAAAKWHRDGKRLWSWYSEEVKRINKYHNEVLEPLRKQCTAMAEDERLREQQQRQQRAAAEQALERKRQALEAQQRAHEESRKQAQSARNQQKDRLSPDRKEEVDNIIKSNPRVQERLAAEKKRDAFVKSMLDAVTADPAKEKQKAIEAPVKYLADQLAHTAGMRTPSDMAKEAEAEYYKKREHELYREDTEARRVQAEEARKRGEALQRESSRTPLVVATYTDPATGQRYTIPPGSTLYRASLAGPLVVVADNDAPARGDNPTLGRAGMGCSQDGVGRVTVECEKLRAFLKPVGKP